MMQVFIDRQGYYTEENTGKLAPIYHMPVTNGTIEKLKCYKYDPDNMVLVLDEERWAKVKIKLDEEYKKQQEELAVKIEEHVTVIQRLDALESAIMEIAANM